MFRCMHNMKIMGLVGVYVAVSSGYVYCSEGPATQSVQIPPLFKKWYELQAFDGSLEEGLPTTTKELCVKANEHFEKFCNVSVMNAPDSISTEKERYRQSLIDVVKAFKKTKKDEFESFVKQVEYVRTVVWFRMEKIVGAEGLTSNQLDEYWLVKECVDACDSIIEQEYGRRDSIDSNKISTRINNLKRQLSSKSDELLKLQDDVQAKRALYQIETAGLNRTITELNQKMLASTYTFADMWKAMACGTLCGAIIMFLLMKHMHQLP